VLEILKYPNPILKKIAQDIDLSSQADKDLVLNNVKEMACLMYDTNGVGLAAPQVGISKKFFILDINQKIEEDDDGNIIKREPGILQVFINPVITNPVGTNIYEEGCLSVPGIYEKVKRPKQIDIEYFDASFKKQKITAEGLLATVIQHENDHLEGRLFIERLSTVKKALVKKRLDKNPPM